MWVSAFIIEGGENIMKNKIETTDVYLTAALLTLGAKLEGTDKSDPRHMKFTIVPNEPSFQSENIPAYPAGAKMPIDLEFYENQWANGVLVLNAVQFKDAIQRMKSVIHSK
jgi:hypothetical protein